MMKTITVTYHYGTSYGAVLQAYALQHMLLELGCASSLLELKYPSPQSRRTFTPKALARKWFLKYLAWKRRDEMNILRNHFNAFTASHLKQTRLYSTMEELRADPPNADLLITGSDQVWNLTSRPDFIPARFLDFGSPNIRRISFAASIERLNYTEEQKATVKEYLHAFDAISLREESARQYVENFADVRAERILDPVFLLDANAWHKIATPPRINAPYILCYQVLRNRNMQKVVNSLTRKTGLPTVSIYNSPIKWIHSDHSFFDVSIEEFLGFYLNASIIVTTSFHGTALGLVFGKPTYGMVKEGVANRITEILDLFGLNQFIVPENADVGKIPKPTINLDELNVKLQIEREKALGFLKRNLN